MCLAEKTKIFSFSFSVNSVYAFLLRTRARKEIPDEEEGGHQGGPVAKLQKSYFDVPGICCSSEIPLVENILKPVDGVKDVSVIVVSRTVIVVHDSLLVSQSQICTKK